MQWPRPIEAQAACVEGGEVNDPQPLMARLKQIYRENPAFRAVNGERWGLSRGDRQAWPPGGGHGVRLER